MLVAYLKRRMISTTSAEELKWSSTIFWMCSSILRQFLRNSSTDVFFQKHQISIDLQKWDGLQKNSCGWRNKSYSFFRLDQHRIFFNDVTRTLYPLRAIISLLCYAQVLSSKSLVLACLVAFNFFQHFYSIWTRQYVPSNIIFGLQEFWFT